MKHIIFLFLYFATALSHHEVFRGEFHKLMSNDDVETLYVLKTATHVFDIIFDSDTIGTLDISTGDAGYVKGYREKNTTVRAFSYFVDSRESIPLGTPYDITSIGFVVNVCGHQAVDRSAIEAHWTSPVTDITVH